MKNEQLVDTIKITLILSEAVIILNDSFTVCPLSVITVEGDDIYNRHGKLRSEQEIVESPSDQLSTVSKVFAQFPQQLPQPFVTLEKLLKDRSPSFRHDNHWT